MRGEELLRPCPRGPRGGVGDVPSDQAVLRSGLVLAVSIVTTVALTLSAAAGSSPTAAKTALRVTWQSRLTLWNHLGSEDQVTHSRVGPNLSLRYLAPGCWDTSEPAFVPGVEAQGDHHRIGRFRGQPTGSATRSSPRPTRSTRPTTEPSSSIQGEAARGSVAHGDYRIYDGGYGPEVGGPALWVYTDNVHPGALLYFVLGAGTSQYVYATSVSPVTPGSTIRDRLKTWTDAVIMWDRGASTARATRCVCTSTGRSRGGHCQHVVLRGGPVRGHRRRERRRDRPQVRVDG